MRLIDADRLIEILIDKDYIKTSTQEDNARKLLNFAPTVERSKGKWIAKAIGSKTTWYVCSECGRSVIDDTGYDIVESYPFCHCGADMRGEQG